MQKLNKKGKEKELLQYTYSCNNCYMKAFLHVHLDKGDRDFTRFLWLFDPADQNNPFVTFRFKVELFGATCSPFMLNAAITYHLKQNES